MWHFVKKSNKIVGENLLLEKRVKKVEKSIEHIDVELEQIKALVKTNNTTTGNQTPGSGGLTPPTTNDKPNTGGGIPTGDIPGIDTGNLPPMGDLNLPDMGGGIPTGSAGKGSIPDMPLK